MITPDFTAGVARSFYGRYQARGVPCPLVGASKDDEPDEYRNVPAAEPQYHVAAVVNPATGKASSFALRGLAFGFSGSASGYCEKSTVLSISAALLLAVLIAPFMGDYTTPGTALSCGPEVPGATSWRRFPASAQAGLWAMSRLLASPLSEAPGKSRQWTQVSLSCGVVTDMTRTHLTCEATLPIKPESCAKALALAESVLSAGFC